MIRRLWHALKYFRATRVGSRTELDTALDTKPRYIVVLGTEALRAYAASLAYRGGQEAAALEAQAALPAYMVVPTVGRIRDGYRHRGPDRRRRQGRRSHRMRLQAGMGTVIAAAVALLALLAAEWLLWPSADPELVRGPHHVAAPVRRGVTIPLPTHAPLPLPPSLQQQVVHVVIPALMLVALGALVFLAWQAVGSGRAARVSWRVERRVQGQLVMARVRTRIA